MPDPEELRKQCYALLGRLSADGVTTQQAFDLLETIVRRLDRLELGTFNEDEIITRPDHASKSQSLRAVKAPKDTP